MRIKLANYSVLVVASYVILFYSIGFHGINFADEGFVLNQARRIILGQTPHVDFISIRLSGSALLHAIYAGLNSNLLVVSRIFVLAEFYMIAILWNEIFWSSHSKRPSLTLKLTSFLIIIIGNLHTFPLMAFQSVDALFLSTISIYLILSTRLRLSIRLRYVLSGIFMIFAVTCKQNFIVLLILIPLIEILRNKKDRNLLISLFGVGTLTGIILYLLVFLPFPENFFELAAEQVTTKASFNVSNWFNPVLSISKLNKVILLSALVLILIERKTKFQKFQDINQSILSIIISFFIVYYTIDFGTFAWLLFVILAFKVIVQIIFGQEPNTFETYLIFFSLTISISGGYPSPALLQGNILLTLIAPFLVKNFKKDLSPIRKAFGQIIFLSTALILLLDFIDLRLNNIYREAPRSHLTFSLGDIYPAGKHIYTSRSKFEFINSARVCSWNYQEYKIYYGPENPILQLLFNETNPVPFDFPYNNELDGGTAVIRQKVNELKNVKHALMLSKINAINIEYIDIKDDLKINKDLVFYANDISNIFQQQIFSLPYDKKECGYFTVLTFDPIK
jgi:hypothetical protein